jgi:cbb3-type cytochrome oxidase subunit 3
MLDFILYSICLIFIWILFISVILMVARETSRQDAALAKLIRNQRNKNTKK